MLAWVMQGLDDPKLIFQVLPVSLAGRTFNLVSNAERVPGDATLKRLKLGSSFVSGEDSPARSLIIAARANSKRLTCKFLLSGLAQAHVRVVGCCQLLCPSRPKPACGECLDSVASTNVFMPGLRILPPKLRTPVYPSSWNIEIVKCH